MFGKHDSSQLQATNKVLKGGHLPASHFYDSIKESDCDTLSSLTPNFSYYQYSYVSISLSIIQGTFDVCLVRHCHTTEQNRQYNMQPSASQNHKMYSAMSTLSCWAAHSLRRTSALISYICIAVISVKQMLQVMGKHFEMF